MPTYAIGVSRGLEYCGIDIVVLLTTAAMEESSRHFCSQWREGHRSETPCSSICLIIVSMILFWWQR